MKSNIPALDGLRGMACLLVVFAHFLEISNSQCLNFSAVGTMGVLLFFSLSGFLMGYLYLGSSFDKKSVARFYISRVSRIAPAYFFAIAIYYSLSVLISGFPSVDVTQLIRLIFFVGSVSVFWSIPPEIQFYIYFSLFWFLYSAISSSGRTLSQFVYFGSFIIVSAWLIHGRAEWPGITLPSKLHIFFVGVAFSFFAREKILSVFFNKGVNASVFFVSIPCAFIFLDFHNAYQSILFSVAVGFVIFFFSYSNFANKILGFQWVSFLGRSSFSIYLFHGMVLRFIDVAVLDISESSVFVGFLVFILSIVLPVIFFLVAERRVNTWFKGFLEQKFLHG